MVTLIISTTLGWYAILQINLTVLEEPSDPINLDSMMASSRMGRDTDISEVLATMEPIINLNGKRESI